MGRAKEIIVKVIPAKIANEFVKKHHYSGKVVQNSNLHFGCFLDNKLHGVMSYGPSINKKAMLNLVVNSKWNEFIELNRMAFDDYLPKNSESRCIAISIKLIKKNAPQIKWIISYADAVQCGDGTIYRASGFLLTIIKENSDLYKMPNGTVSHSLNMKPTVMKKINDRFGGKTGSSIRKLMGAKLMNGKQLRYIYLIDKSCKITVPILPFSKIDEMGAGMYKGQKITIAERQHAVLAQGSASGIQSEGGSRPDHTAQRV